MGCLTGSLRDAGELAGCSHHTVALPRALHLPGSLVLAALLVAVAGSRVALAPSRSDAIGALDAGGAAWMLTGRGNIARDLA